MTTKECFDAMGADYEGVLERFSSEATCRETDRNQGSI